MENSELDIGIGEEEKTSLRPATVKIISLAIEEVGQKKSKKLVCTCKHPEATEPIKISSVKYENKGKLETAGLWINKDSQGLIRKGSALAVLMQATGSMTVELLKEKEVMTAVDEKGYLCFKGY